MAQLPPSPKVLGKRRATFAADPLLHPTSRFASRSALVASRFASGFQYHTPLVAHYGCVNALAFSGGDGTWLASGGDDKRVLLWNSFGDLSKAEPRATYRGARSNIFSIAFTCDNAKLLSGGNDDMVLMHDLETGADTGPARKSHPPTDLWRHEGAVKKVCCHPTNPHLFLSASDDGCVRSFDLRTDLGVVARVRNDSEFNDVAYHPQTPEVFALSDSEGHVRLLDARTAFTDKVDLVANVCVRDYASMLGSPTKKGLVTAQPGEFDASSLTFSPDGRLLCTTVSKYLPTLYDTSEALPIATFSTGPRFGQPGYSNLCTIKHGSFGGTGDDLYFSAGSDDFGVYVWAVPPLEVLKSRRRDPWKSDAVWPTKPDEPSWIAYMDISDANTGSTIPPDLTNPSTVLRAHRSVVNTTLFHPTLPLLFSSGVEKVIQVHSGTPFSATPTPFHPREPFPRREPREEECETTDEDRGILEFFDYLIVREDGLWGGVREGGGVTPRRRNGGAWAGMIDWPGEDDESEEEEEEEEGGDDEEEEEDRDGEEGDGWATEQDSDSGVDEADLLGVAEDG